MMMFNNVQNPPFKMMLNKIFISDQLAMIMIFVIAMMQYL